MTGEREHQDAFDPGLHPQESPELLQLTERLEDERPVPRASFRGELRRQLLKAAERHVAWPRRLRFLVSAYAGSGAALLAIAALGVAGVGPLAAG